MGEILVIDRIENNIAVCENRRNKNIIEISLEKLPPGVKEGTVVRYLEGKFIIDVEKQEEIEKRIEEKMKLLWD